MTCPSSHPRNCWAVWTKAGSDRRYEVPCDPSVCLFLSSGQNITSRSSWASEDLRNDSSKINDPSPSAILAENLSSKLAPCWNVICALSCSTTHCLTCSRLGGIGRNG